LAIVEAFFVTAIPETENYSHREKEGAPLWGRL